MKEAGMVLALTHIVPLLNLKHKMAGKASMLILKSLEMLTREWPARAPHASTQGEGHPSADVRGDLTDQALAATAVTPAPHPDDTDAGPDAMAAAEEVLEAIGRQRGEHSRSRERSHDRMGKDIYMHYP